jgi:PIN domain nuclease of toxin-antitoxin system
MKKVKGWLLDTHALLWMLYGDDRLSTVAAQAIDGDLAIYSSIASFWEIAIKQSGKGFDFGVESNWDELFQTELNRIGVRVLDIGIADCRAIQDLPMHHRDPFDRMLVAQAVNFGLGIISKDKIFAVYPVVVNW